MDRISLFRLSGLPDAFGAILLILALILLLAPYFSGADFGIFKIPLIGLSGKRWLRLLGPVMFVLCILSFLPVISTTRPQSEPSPSPGEPRITSVPTPTFAPTTTPIPVLEPTPTPIVVNAKRQAEKLGAELFAALNGNNATALIEMADPPFLFGDKLLVGPEDIRQEIGGTFSQTDRRPGSLQFEDMRAVTIAESRETDVQLVDAPFNVALVKRHRLYLARLNLSDNDFVVILRFNADRGECFVLYTRKVGSEIKLAGMWKD